MKYTSNIFLMTTALKITAPLLLTILLLTQTIPKTQAYPVSIEEISEKIAPSAGVYIPVAWGNLLNDLRLIGAVDPLLLNETLSKSQVESLTAEEYSLFYENSTRRIQLNSESKTFLLYVFWAFGLSNNNTILDGHAHMLGNQTSPVGITKYGSVNILKLTPEQQTLVEDVALNSYRPCCNAATIIPDCSHGFAALGFIELLASKEFSREEIFRNLLLFNTYMFTKQYIDIALYVEEQDQSWAQVNATQILGYSHSSLEAYLTMKKYLAENNLYDPFSDSYLIDPLSRYKQPTLILLTTVFITLVLTLGWLILRRSDSDEDVKQ